MSNYKDFIPWLNKDTDLAAETSTRESLKLGTAALLDEGVSDNNVSTNQVINETIETTVINNVETTVEQTVENTFEQNIQNIQQTNDSNSIINAIIYG